MVIGKRGNFFAFFLRVFYFGFLEILAIIESEINPSSFTTAENVSEKIIENFPTLQKDGNFVENGEKFVGLVLDWRRTILAHNLKSTFGDHTAQFV